MDPFDSIKRRVDGLLPPSHRWLLVALAAILVIVTHENDYEGVTLVSRHSLPDPVIVPAVIAESAPTANDGVLQASGSLTARVQPLPVEPEPVLPESVLPGPALPEPTVPVSVQPAPTLPEPAVAATGGPDYVTEVKAGDNLSLIFDRAGLTPRDVYMVTRSAPQARLLNNLYPGYTLEFFMNDAGALERLVINQNKLESTAITRDDQGNYVAEEIVRKPEIRQVFREATIEDSMFLAAQRGGISAAITMELAGIFGGVIDFLLDTRRGDTFNLLYEEKYLNGEYIGNGAILAAQFTNQGETYTAVRYVNTAGETDFYNPEGESMRKAFLRNPVDFTRISSNFSLNRKHPILNTIRAHKGTDYAAPRGTPVVAAANGRVTWAARNGSFGNLVVIQHGERFETKYAHLNEYARGIKEGARVRQGQVIGYVGSTGGATGPHLHYEFLMDGVHRNSRTIHDKLPKAESVPGEELQRFREHTQILLAQLEVHSSNTKNIAFNTHDDPQ